MNAVEKEEYLALFGTSLAHLLSHAFILAIPVVIAFLKLSYADGGILSGVLFVTYGLTTLPSGWISDKIGERLVIIIYFILSGVGSVLMLFINSFTSLLLIAGVIGLAGGLYHPVGLSLISKVFKEKRGRAMGIHGVAGNVGLTIAQPVAGLAVVTFRWTFILLPFGIIAFIGALIFLFRPSWFENDHSPKPTEEIPSVAKTSPKTLFTKYFILILILAACNGIIFDGVKAFMHTYLVYARSFSEVNATYITGGLIFSVGMVSQIVFGHLVDTRGTYRALLWSFVFLFFTVLLVPFLSGFLFLMLLPFFGFAIVSAQPGLNTMVAEASTEETRGLAYGLNFFMTYGIGGLASPFVGLVADRFTSDYIFYILLVFALIGLLVLLFILPRTTPEASELSE